MPSTVRSVWCPALLAIDELGCAASPPAGRFAVVCFVEEEGGRFGLPCLGSRLMTGAVDPDSARRLHDPDGVSLAEAAKRAGLDPAGMGPDPARLAAIGTFVELHVEQGRLLAAADPAAVVGIGSEIVAHGRWRFTVTGQGNHAGTTAAGRPARSDDPGRGRRCSPPAGRSATSPARSPPSAGSSRFPAAPTSSPRRCTPGWTFGTNRRP